MAVKDPNPQRQPLMQRPLLEDTQKRWLPNLSLRSQNLRLALHLNRSVLHVESITEKNTTASLDRPSPIVLVYIVLVQDLFELR